MSAPQVTIKPTCYLVPQNGTVHRVRRDGICTCGGTPQQPCAATPLVQTYLANGGQRPPGRDESTWPETWTTVPSHCPVCDCPTIPDRHLNSRAGPGWRCSLTKYEHFWRVRMNPLRRYLAANPPDPRYPWYDTVSAERQAWLDAHYYPPRLRSTAPKAVAPAQKPKGVEPHALDRAKTSPCQSCPWLTGPWLDLVRIQGRPIRFDDRLLRSCLVGRDR